LQNFQRAEQTNATYNTYLDIYSTYYCDVQRRAQEEGGEILANFGCSEEAISEEEA
jgi:hypothetical protein